MTKNQRGFTLLELLVVIAIIGILVSIVIVAIDPVQRLREARDTVRKTDVRAIALALNIYRVDNGYFPKESGCDSSKGQANGPACDWTGSIPPPNGNDWENTVGGYIKDALVPKYMPRLPKDPINNSLFYYSYEPRDDPYDDPKNVVGTANLCRNDGNDPAVNEGYCQSYAVTAHLEADPNTTFTCSNTAGHGWEPSCYVRHDLTSI